MSNTWEQIKSVRDSRASLRERLAQRKKARENIIQTSAVSLSSTSSSNSTTTTTTATTSTSSKSKSKEKNSNTGLLSLQDNANTNASSNTNSDTATDTPTVTDASQSLSSVEKLQNSKDVTETINPKKAEITITSEDEQAIENLILLELDSPALNLPIDAITLSERVLQDLKISNCLQSINKTLLKLETQCMLVTEQKDEESIKILSANHDMVLKVIKDKGVSRKRSKASESQDEVPEKKKSKSIDKLNIETLLATETAKEKETKKLNEEIQDLLNTASAKEQMMSSKFKSQGGSMKKFCPCGTRADCRAMQGSSCDKVHFRRLRHKHTDESLGDCSFLNTCFHMDTCKYIHYEVDQDDLNRIKQANMSAALRSLDKSKQSDFKMMAPQWIQCDMRTFDMTVLGKFAVIMADPPWDIHMELPYGTMSDDEMRGLNIPCLQDDGYIFLWVTGRAMELGRECLELWGYRRCDELIWVKTNQLQKLIRTGRTGHWINHGKEHCLIGVKGNPQNTNRGLDCDVIVAEVRATSHKPDEIYGVIERLSPGTRKIELFGRPHNVQPNWLTLGNQLDGVQLHEEDVKKSFKKKYPDGKCI